MKKKKSGPQSDLLFPHPGKIYLQLIKIANYYFSKKKNFKKSFLMSVLLLTSFLTRLSCHVQKESLKKKYSVITGAA